MKIKTKAKIFSLLCILSYLFGINANTVIYATTPSEKAIDVVDMQPTNTANLELDLNSAVVHFGRTNSRNQIDTIVNAIRHGNIEISENEKRKLLTAIISWGGCYLTRIAALSITPNREIDEETIIENMQLVNICNELLQFFLELDDNNIVIDSQNEMGNTLLHDAIMHHNNEALRILLDHGADANITNIYGQTPYAFALSFTTRFSITTNSYQSVLDAFHAQGITQ